MPQCTTFTQEATVSAEAFCSVRNLRIIRGGWDLAYWERRAVLNLRTVGELSPSAEKADCGEYIRYPYGNMFLRRMVVTIRLALITSEKIGMSSRVDASSLVLLQVRVARYSFDSGPQPPVCRTTLLSTQIAFLAINRLRSWRDHVFRCRQQATESAWVMSSQRLTTVRTIRAEESICTKSKSIMIPNRISHR